MRISRTTRTSASRSSRQTTLTTSGSTKSSDASGSASATAPSTSGDSRRCPRFPSPSLTPCLPQPRHRRHRSRSGTCQSVFSLLNSRFGTHTPIAGTPEAGGWTVREVKRIIRGLAGLNFVGADVVEVAPAYDHGMSSRWPRTKRRPTLTLVLCAVFSRYHGHRCGGHHPRLPRDDAVLRAAKIAGRARAVERRAVKQNSRCGLFCFFVHL